LASFKAHISFGVLSAIALSVAIVILAWAPVEVVPLVFMLTVIGSMLPDIDSDSGIPVKILFFILAIIVAFAIFSNFQFSSHTGKELILMSLGSGLFVYFVVRFIFKKIPTHRGIFHSIPMALIMGLLAIVAMSPYQFSNASLRVVGASVVVGYLCHLILDELNSAVNLSGTPFIPKKSLGSALKLTVQSRILTIFMYIVLLLLVFVNQKIIIY
jgi:membrane-bound metal-dependent hydrolase YbcI (DUF457 family)